MRTVLALLVTLSATVAVETVAQTPVGESPRQPAPPDDRTHVGTGVVNAVDVRRGLITLRHEPIPGIALDAQVSSFVVADRAQLAALKPGQAVSFQIKPLGNQYMVSEVRRR
ncbi:MAG: copper-binding protein [Gammaproteobacteria bacterium]